MRKIKHTSVIIAIKLFNDQALIICQNWYDIYKYIIKSIVYAKYILDRKVYFCTHLILWCMKKNLNYVDYISEVYKYYVQQYMIRLQRYYKSRLVQCHCDSLSFHR